MHPMTGAESSPLPTSDAPQVARRESRRRRRHRRDTVQELGGPSDCHIRQEACKDAACECRRLVECCSGRCRIIGKVCDGREKR